MIQPDNVGISKILRMSDAVVKLNEYETRLQYIDFNITFLYTF